MRLFVWTGSIALVVVVAYLAVAAYAGVLVARGIGHAEATSLVTRVGMRFMRREHVEQLAIERGHVPKLITASPTFWLALRAKE